MKEETHEKIREALNGLHEATCDVQGLSAFAIVMPHGTRGQMRVQMMSKGSDQDLAHKFYECMRYSELLSFDLRNIVMTAAAKYLGEQDDEAKQAFDRTVERCRQQWQDTQEVKAVIDDCREVIDEYNKDQEDGEV